MLADYLQSASRSASPVCTLADTNATPLLSEKVDVNAETPNCHDADTEQTKDQDHWMHATGMVDSNETDTISNDQCNVTESTKTQNEVRMTATPSTSNRVIQFQ